MKYFGIDGIRGHCGVFITSDLAVKVGRALSSFNCNKVVVGTDTRKSKDMLRCSLACGCLDVGIDVLFAGVVSTPAIIYYSKIYKCIGVMITASHNPYSENGIKIFYCGKKLDSNQETLIEQKIEHNNYISKKYGNLAFDNHAISSYLELLSSKIVDTKLRIGFDCANGSVSNIINKINLKGFFYGINPDGYNINSMCGSTNLALIKSKMGFDDLDIGFAFDGDGDRVIAIARDGKIYNGDKLIYLLAKYLKSQNKLLNNTVVVSKMSDLGMIRALREKDINVVETEVGNKYIKEAMEKSGSILGGENSGHIIYENIFSSGDGLLVSLEIVRILEETNTKLSDWFDYQPYYAEKMNIVVKNRNSILNSIELYSLLETIKEELSDDGKVIVRGSETEKLIRILVMTQDEAMARSKVEIISKKIKSLEESLND